MDDDGESILFPNSTMFRESGKWLLLKQIERRGSLVGAVNVGEMLLMQFSFGMMD